VHHPLQLLLLNFDVPELVGIVDHERVTAPGHLLQREAGEVGDGTGRSAERLLGQEVAPGVEDYLVDGVVVRGQWWWQPGPTPLAV